MFDVILFFFYIRTEKRNFFISVDRQSNFKLFTAFILGSNTETEAASIKDISIILSLFYCQIQITKQ